MVTPIRVLTLVKEKSQQFFASETERFSYKIDKFLTVYQGYNQIKPKVFPKRLSTMFNADVVSTEDKSDRCTQSSPVFATSSSLRRHQRERGIRNGEIDTSSKIKIVLPAHHYSSSSNSTGTSRSTTPTHGGKLRTRRASGPKTPTRIVLASPECASERILCSSVMLTYQEGLFHHSQRNEHRDMVRKDTDV